MQTRVKIFKGFVDDIENIINGWAQQEGITILNTSFCYGEKGGVFQLGHVFVIVVYQRPAEPSA